MTGKKLKNPLHRNGLTRSARSLAALAPEAARIDDRDFDDLLTYAWRFSSQLRFFDDTSLQDDQTWTVAGTWQEMLRVEPAFYLAIIASASPKAVQKQFESGLLLCEEQHDLAAWRLKIEDVMQIVAGIFYEIEGFRTIFPPSSVAAQRLSSFIDSRLKQQAVMLLGLYRTVISDRQTLENSFRHRLAAWDMDYDGAHPQNYAADELHDLLVKDLRNLFEAIIDTRTSLNTDAGRLLTQTLGNRDHQPHIGLFFAFLRLFQQTQAQMNSLTGRHLDFYFRDLLKLTLMAPVPDRAHLIFTPDARTPQHKLAAGTLFKAGKDSLGRELHYLLPEDFIVNQAKVTRLMNCFCRLDHPAAGARILKVHQGVKADSADGLAAKLDESNPKWPVCGNADYPAARIGFGFSSPILRLSEGKRTIAVVMTFKDIAPLATGLFPGGIAAGEIEVTRPILTVLLSGKKKWLAVVPKIKIHAALRTMTISLDLDFDFKEIADYRAAVLADETDLQCGWPVLKCLINQEAGDAVYAGFSGLELVKTRVTVIADQVRNLVLQNDLGVIKTGKPFQPFGPMPTVGSKLYVGHAEAFAKKLDSVQLKWNWVDLPADLDTYYSAYLPTTTSFETKTKKPPTADAKTKGIETAESSRPSQDNPTEKAPTALFQPTVNVEILQQHEWQPLRTSMHLPLSGTALNFATFTPTGFPAASDAGPFKAFGSDLSRGGIRLVLTSPAMAFGHKDYPKLHAQAIAASLRTSNPSTTLLNSLNPPVTPVFENFTLKYTSSEEHPAGGDNSAFVFFHLHPFGFEKTAPVSLTPSLSDEGTLYIGLTGCQPPQTIAILFQFAEGSGDPFVAPPTKVAWSCLTSTGWVELPPRKIISDTTRGFLESGVITFPLPAEAVSTSTILPQGQHWLRLSVSDNSRALHDLMSITAQAATVVFEDQDNAPDHLVSPLPAGSISKFKSRDGGIKKIEQPYASMGGRAPEASPAFRTRVSERLRHKDRAVTIWDYEHLVMENFPDIYKVKCLNHTDLNSEIVPGKVLVVVIPDLQQKNSRYPLRPAVPQSRLREIADFLRGKASPWAEIQVVNPLYETVRVSGMVHYYPKFAADPGYYRQQLHADLTRMLTPWLYGAAEIGFGGRLHRSAIINFIEELDYVDYLTDFGLTQWVEDQSWSVAEEVIATTSRSILVSHASHLIDGA